MKHITGLLLTGCGLTLALLPAAHAETPDVLRDAHYLRCAKPVFYAQTLNHKKEVEICIVTPSVAYSFGRTGAEHKEMDIAVPAQKTGYAYQSNQVISLQEFSVRNGDTTYQVSAGSNDEGKPFAALDVYRGSPDTGKHLATIALDPDTVVNDISHGLQDEGIPRQDDL
ncbi:hypothetical protein MF265_10025 [Serratia marcescens]|uniref:hypothetical protein n=1 Tax=Serratia marcescens TaxID=615 RepID=UPI001EF1262B|nr:hypothetical protein [Serratia marcescens]ULH13064.1 hypothetical protein MF265_10025 [Serratia marcescens]